MSNELICIVSLSVLCIYQSYRFWKLEKLVFTQLSKIWDFQHDVINAIDNLRIVKELEVEYLTRSSNNENNNNENKKNEERNIDE